MFITNASYMQQMDRTAINKLKIPGIVLMENAGCGVCNIMMKHMKESLSPYVAIIAGPGNNGGDGFVVARHLHQHGISSKIILLSPVEKFKGDARINLDILIKLNMPIHEILDNTAVQDSSSVILHAGCIVDAIFGTGLSREVKDRFASIIDVINRSNRPVISVDIPSGLNADTGHVLGTAVRADITATMALPKTGQVIYPGIEYVGQLEVVDIGMPPEVIETFQPYTYLLDNNMAQKMLPDRAPEAHKGTFGHVLIISGSPGKAGAAELAVRGALGSGAGLVSLATPDSIWPVMMEKLTEAMTIALPSDTTGEISSNILDTVLKYTEGKRAIAIGPGIGLGKGPSELVRALAKEVKIPMILDADALTAIGTNHGVLKQAEAPRILTPHPGEAARLLNTSSGNVQKDRIGSAKRIAEDTGAVVVLKGARTIIASPSGDLAINPTGNPGLAAGGMGDVLTGIISGLVSQGLSPWEASCLGVYAHGMSADILSRTRGPWGFKASELANELPRVWKQIDFLNPNRCP